VSTFALRRKIPPGLGKLFLTPGAARDLPSSPFPCGGSSRVALRHKRFRFALRACYALCASLVPLLLAVSSAVAFGSRQQFALVGGHCSENPFQ
jgi:hypothetical protein